MSDAADGSCYIIVAEHNDAYPFNAASYFVYYPHCSFFSARIMNEVVVDIGVNLTHRAFRKHWKNVVQRALDAGVTKLILTGTSIQGSEECLGLCQTWLEETGEKNLFATVGMPR